MADTPQPRPSSLFDDMLAQNRKRIDDLYHGDLSKGAVATEVGDSTASAPGRPALASSPPSVMLDPSSSPAIRRLNACFGNDWSYEIVDRRRDDDEAIVLCRLTFGKSGVVRSQFGRAKLRRGPKGGSSGGLQFTLAMGDGAQDEGDAFRRATEAALMNCLDLS